MDNLEQDLRDIFDAGVITTQASIQGVDLPGIFRAPFLQAQIGVGVAASEPTLTVLDADLATLPQAMLNGDAVQLTERGETWYFHEKHPAGNGMTVLVLTEEP